VCDSNAKIYSKLYTGSACKVEGEINVDTTFIVIV